MQRSPPLPTGTGIARQLCGEASSGPGNSGSPPLVVLMHFCSEGDNTPHAVSMAEVVNSSLKLLPAGDEDGASPMGESSICMGVFGDYLASFTFDGAVVERLIRETLSSHGRTASYIIRQDKNIFCPILEKKILIRPNLLTHNPHPAASCNRVLMLGSMRVKDGEISAQGSHVFSSHISYTLRNFGIIHRQPVPTMQIPARNLLFAVRQ